MRTSIFAPLTMVIAFVLVGCQSAPQISISSNALLVEAVDRPPFLKSSDSSSISIESLLPDEKPFSLNEEMRMFAHYYAPRSLMPEYRMRQLLWAMMSPSGLGLQYSPNITYSSQESFERREANCLSFTILFIALAEEVGLDADFNEVDVPPVWDLQEENRLIYYKHVNALVDLPLKKDKIVDINMENYNENYKQRKLSKVGAEALYYNNRGVEEMALGNYEAAYLMLRKAIALNQKLGLVYGSLGTLYKRLGFYEHAEALYSYALSEHGFDSVVAGNLARVYRIQGRTTEAMALEESIAKVRDRNPYFQYALAIAALEKNDDEAALVLIDRAIDLHRKDHRFFHLRAKLHARLGMSLAANRDLLEAKDVASEYDIKERYQSKIDRLAALH